ncbi:MAG: type I restriction-modification system subunit M [Aquabacterium sp.]|nr:type I restriction-modification system subunit M [Aquabacterium sp.]
MTSTALDRIDKIEASLWEAADQLRANSKLTSSEYCMPVLGVIFLRHASNRYDAALAAIQADQAAGRMPKRKLLAADFVRRRALMLPPQAHYKHLLALPKGSDLGAALVAAMEAIEADFEPLAGQLPKDYDRFESRLLEDLLRAFDTDALRQASGDVFGRIYEYFLMKFAMQGAQDNGEFFTPPSLVQMIVNVIEPDHGVVADLACGSGGMFVQSSHFIEHEGLDTMKRVTFYGQEKTATTIRLAKMNLAVHGLEGDILEANTFYDDPHRLPDGRPLWGHCDFLMANPPFNVDMVDADRVKDDRRLPFGLPGVNKARKVGNANYLWISYFHSYLSPQGRAGFVMSSQASSAGHGEAEVRRRLIETGDVDVMIAIRPNFFYTRTVPCELWFYDRGKPAERRDRVLMLDARQVYRKVTRKIYDFSPEQLADLTAVVWLYRGWHERFEALLVQHLGTAVNVAERCWLDEDADPACEPLDDFVRAYKALRELMQPFVASLPEGGEHEAAVADYPATDSDPVGAVEAMRMSTTDLSGYWLNAGEGFEAAKAFHRDSLVGYAERARDLSSLLDHATRATLRMLDLAEKQLGARDDDRWPTREIGRARKVLEAARGVAVEHLKRVRHFQRHATWLLERFPEARYRDVTGLCKVVTRGEIEDADWSLTPGRYVGVAPVEEDEAFDFEAAVTEVRSELSELNQAAAVLADRIDQSMAELLT